jgi:hypothetical protein
LRRRRSPRWPCTSRRGSGDTCTRAPCRKDMTEAHLKGTEHNTLLRCCFVCFPWCRTHAHLRRSVSGAGLRLSELIQSMLPASSGRRRQPSGPHSSAVRSAFSWWSPVLCSSEAEQMTSSFLLTSLVATVGVCLVACGGHTAVSRFVGPSIFSGVGWRSCRLNLPAFTGDPSMV